MQLPAKTLDIIIKAYGFKNPLPSRLDAAALTQHLRDRVESADLYPDITPDQRQTLLNDLRLYQSYLASEDAITRSRWYYFHGLRHCFRKFASGPQNWWERSENNLFKLLRWGMNTPETFKFIKNIVTHSTSHLPEPDSVYHLLKLTNLRKRELSISQNFFMAATHFLRDEQAIIREHLHSFSAAFDREVRARSLEDLYMPPTGPETSEDLLFCLRICVINIGYQASPAVLHAMIELYDQIRALNADLPESHLSRLEMPTKSSALLELNGIETKDSIHIAIGMTRYFIEHHGDKIPADHTLAIGAKLQELYLESYAVYSEQREKTDNPIDAEEREFSISEMFKSTWQSIQKPSAEDIMKKLSREMGQRKFVRFKNMIDSAPDSMGVVVSYYVTQDATLRKLRRNFFKNSGPQEGQEAYKNAFLKSLALNHSDALHDIGLSDHAIRQMVDYGKIPEEESRYLGTLTVDHIVDLHSGGTNHPLNLALMTETLNKLKNDLLLLQTGLDGDNSEKVGRWVLTLRPRNDANGMPLKILTDPLKTPASAHKDHSRIPNMD